MLYVGQEVTPIRTIPRIAATPTPGRIVSLPGVPERGEVYTIDWIGEGLTCTILGLREFPEITMPVVWFRPVDKPKEKTVASTSTGMEILKTICREAESIKESP